MGPREGVGERVKRGKSEKYYYISTVDVKSTHPELILLNPYTGDF